MRSRLGLRSNGVRLVHGEADGLPGLIVDRYEDILSVQFLATGVERWKAVIADALLAATGCTRLYERSDSSVRQLEGLEPVKGWLRGEGDTRVLLREHDIRSPSMSRQATRPATTSTSARTARCSRGWCASSAARAC